MMLELKNICKTYEQGKLDVPVLNDVSLTVEEGEYLAIMGPSGSGKTTLMNIIGCLDNPTSGQYLLEGEELSQQSDGRLSQVRLHSIGFVFQSFHLLPRQTAIENVALPLLYAGVRKKERLEIAKKALERVGLGDRVNFKPTQLSGGQCQRVAIARAIVNNPKILLADEPTGALDTKSGEQIMELFQKLHSEGVTIVMITHEQEIANHAERILHIRDGNLIDTGRTPRESAEASAPTPEPTQPEHTVTHVDLTDVFAREPAEASAPMPEPTQPEHTVTHVNLTDVFAREPAEAPAPMPEPTQSEHTVTHVDLTDVFAREPAEATAPMPEPTQPEHTVTHVDLTNVFARESKPEIDIESIDIQAANAADEQESEAVQEEQEEKVPFDTASFEFIQEPEPEPRGQFGAPMKTEIDLSGVFGKSIPTPPQPAQNEGGYQKLIEINDLGLGGGAPSVRKEDDQ